MLKLTRPRAATATATAPAAAARRLRFETSPAPPAHGTTARCVAGVAAWLRPSSGPHLPSRQARDDSEMTNSLGQSLSTEYFQLLTALTYSHNGCPHHQVQLPMDSHIDEHIHLSIFMFENF